MSNPMTLYLDNYLYNVAVDFPSLKRKFEIVEGSSAGTSIRGKVIRDVMGTSYTYTMTVKANPSYPTDYDAFFNQMRNPTLDTHTLKVPYGQGELTLTCYITDGEDTYQGYYNGYKRWDELNLTVKTVSLDTTGTSPSPGFNIWTIGGSY